MPSISVNYTEIESMGGGMDMVPYKCMLEGNCFSGEVITELKGEKSALVEVEG